MKRLLCGFVLVALAALLSGCYYQPSYGYVRATPYAGPAYYGTATVYNDGYYAAPGWYGYGDGWYGGYGCCYAPGWTVGGVWYGHRDYRHYHGGYHGGGYMQGHAPGHPVGGGYGHWGGHAYGNHH